MTAAKLTDLDLERTYIASLLTLDREFQATHVVSTDRLEPADCASFAHQQILELAYDLTAKGERVDWLTMTEGLERSKASSVTHEALTECMGSTFTTEYPDVSQRLTQLARRRRTRELLMRAIGKVDAADMESAQELTREAAGEATDTRRSVITTIGHAGWQAAYQIRHGSDADPARLNARTGYGTLDFAIKSILKATMFIVGGRTGCGKSNLMLGMAILQATEQSHKPGIVSLEDSAEIWGARALSYFDSFVSAQNIIDSGNLPADYRNELIAHAVSGCQKLANVGIELTYPLNRPLTDVLQAIRELVTQKGCTIIYVDYLQAVKLGDSRDHKRTVSNAAQAIKGLCQSLGVPLVLGSQLSRPTKEKPFAEPHVSELKESGDLENMAEIILLLWKTSDEENADILGKVAKVKWSPRRPRVRMNFNENGSIHSMVEHKVVEEQSAAPARQQWGAR